MSAFPGIRTTEQGVVVDLKVVPGAKSNTIAGALGDRIKIRVSAPPEDGRANRAIVKMLASRLEHSTGLIELIAGHHASEKTVLLHETDARHVRERLLKDPSRH